MKSVKIVVFILVVLTGAILRLYQLDKIPAGLYTDEAALGYDAYSLLLTGKDQYGKSFPIFLKSFGDFKSPLYAYLTTLPVYFFDLSHFSVRFISAISGIIVIVLTYLLFWNFKQHNYTPALISAALIAISPWNILFSRHALEANLALALLAISIFFFNLSIKLIHYFVWACVFLGISTYAYHAERFFSFLFLLCFIGYFRKELLIRSSSVFLANKWLIIGIILFLVIQIPQFALFNTAAFNVRINQVNYLTNDFFVQNGGELGNLPLGKELFITREFLSQYLAYFSPKNLFFQPDSQIIRSMPDLSVFYSWMFIPFLFGIKPFLKNRKETILKIVSLILLISPIPAALTRDPFYTLRALPLFWGLTFIITLGILDIFQRLSHPFAGITSISILAITSFVSLYSSYFILFKYERANDYGFSFIELTKKTMEFNNEEFIVDAGRGFGQYIYFAFYKKYDPRKLQENINREVLVNYYNSIDIGKYPVIDNIVVKPIVWDKDLDKKRILVGDTLAFSDKQITEHKLTPAFEIHDLNNAVSFKAYFTHPELKPSNKGIIK